TALPKTETGLRRLWLWLWLWLYALCLLAATSAASKGNAADTASKEEASAPHELNGVRHSRLSQALRDFTRHQVQADPWPASSLRLPDDGAECHRRADPCQGDAGDFDDR